MHAGICQHGAQGQFKKTTQEVNAPKQRAKRYAASTTFTTTFLPFPQVLHSRLHCAVLDISHATASANKSMSSLLIHRGSWLPRYMAVVACKRTPSKCTQACKNKHCIDWCNRLKSQILALVCCWPNTDIPSRKHSYCLQAMNKVFRRL